MIYKTLSYRNQGFSNVIDDNSYDFKRNENANLFGLDLLAGKQYKPFKSNLNLELFGGLGARYRVRKFTTISSRYNSPPVGSYVLEQFYPTIIFGFKVGFNMFLKK